MRANKPDDYKSRIARSGLTIDSPIEIADANLWIPTSHLERLLNAGLKGLDLGGLALRTRSKFVKQAVCEALGYPVPNAFKRTRPRFLGQQLDIFVQKSNNLQIWNEQLSPTRRYAVLQVSEADIIVKVRVVNGEALARLDTTGKITTKYQAAFVPGAIVKELISSQDTQLMLPFVHAGKKLSPSMSPAADPEVGSLLSIGEIFNRLSKLVGRSFPDPGIDQERNRGAALHKLICGALGYRRFDDNGQFPDIRHQLLEVKLQTSPTIDLGLVLPNSEATHDIQPLGTYRARHCDTRYALFYALRDGKKITLTHLCVTTGADFFTRFRRFEGNGRNGKIQLPLPKNFFGS